MRISFDLDQTLIPYSDEFETEPRNWFQKLLKVEKIRKGTIQLFQNLYKQGHQIDIYTTSYRAPYKVRFNFRTYGLLVNEIITQKQHQRIVKYKCSKYPPAFSIDVHIDDSEGVKKEGELFNFKTIIVSPLDKNWESTIQNNLISI